MDRSTASSDRSTASSSNSTSDEHELLSADHDEAPQAPSLDVGSSSASVAHKKGVPYEQDIYTEKYIAQWKPDHIM